MTLNCEQKPYCPFCKLVYLAKISTFNIDFFYCLELFFFLFFHVNNIIILFFRDKEICNNHMSNVCVQRFIENKDKLLSNFMSDFQRLTMSDEKVLFDIFNFF